MALLWLLTAFGCAPVEVLPEQPAPGAGPDSFEALRIAHAGGALRKRSYTNSYQALNRNLKRGFRYFELDLIFARDQQLVCLHDWDANFRSSFGFNVEVIPSLAEFEAFVAANTRFTNCTLDGLAQWLREHPQATIVTDIRGPLEPALRKVFETLPDAATRVIPQIYAPEQYPMVRDIGFQAFIWTLYRYDGGNEDVLRIVEGWTGPFAVTMPESRANTALPRELAEQGIKTYVHTINAMDKWRHYRQQGVTEMYTAFLAPDS